MTKDELQKYMFQSAMGPDGIVGTLIDISPVNDGSIIEYSEFNEEGVAVYFTLGSFDYKQIKPIELLKMTSDQISTIEKRKKTTIFEIYRDVILKDGREGSISEIFLSPDSPQLDGYLVDVEVPDKDGTVSDWNTESFEAKDIASYSERLKDDFSKFNVGYKVFLKDGNNATVEKIIKSPVSVNLDKYLVKIKKTNELVTVSESEIDRYDNEFD